MTKEEILSDLKFIADNFDRIIEKHNDYAAAYGMLSALVQMTANEIPINREAAFKPTLGQTATCSQCGNFIQFDGRVWFHVNGTFRHAAFPERNPNNAKAFE